MFRLRHRRHGLPAICVLATSVLLLSGCAVAQQSSSSGGERVEGGSLVIASAADAQPQFALAGRAGNWSWKRLVFDTLIEIDPSGTASPVLATDWSFSDDRLALSLTLRDDVTFHSGRRFTADDVTYSLERAKDPASASQLRAAAENIDTIEKVSDTEVILHLVQPSDSMLDLLDLTAIVDEDTWAEAADGETLIGTGPYTWQDWVPGASISLERYDDYWGETKVALDEVSVSVISDSTALQSAMTSGAVDVAIGMAQSDLLRLTQDERYQLVESGGAVYPLGFDVREAPFDTPAARQAIGYAIDRERIVEQVFGGDATATDLWWTPSAEGYPTDLETHYSYDPDKAEKLLDESGAAGAELTITYLNQPVLRNLVEVLQNNLTDVGLKVTAEGLDATEFDKRQVDGALGQAFVLYHPMIGFSPSTMLSAMPAIRPGNPSHFASPEFDRLTETLTVSAPAERGAALTEVTEFMLDEAFSHTVVSAPQYHVRAADIEGLRVATLGSLILTDAHLTK